MRNHCIFFFAAFISSRWISFDVSFLLIAEQGTLTIVRRSSGKGKGGGSATVDSPTPTDIPDAYLRGQSVDLEELLDSIDLETDSLPAVDTPDACDKAALRLVIKKKSFL